MIIALTCGCHGAEPLVRQFLSSNHHPSPFSAKIYKNEEAKGWANKNNLLDISSYINSRSTYALIVGWGKEKKVHWADINNSYPDQQMKAQVIVEKFA